MPLVPAPVKPRRPHYTGLNPKQKVPFMTDGQFGLSESVAISRYLIERYGSDDTMALPLTIESRARRTSGSPTSMASWTKLPCTSCVGMEICGEFMVMPRRRLQRRRPMLKNIWHVAGQFIDGKDFLVGDRLGLADVMLVSCLDWAVHYGFELADSLRSYQAVHHARDAYRRAFDANYSK